MKRAGGTQELIKAIHDQDDQKQSDAAVNLKVIAKQSGIKQYL